MKRKCLYNQSLKGLKLFKKKLKRKKKLKLRKKGLLKFHNDVRLNAIKYGRQIKNNTPKQIHYSKVGVLPNYSETIKFLFEKNNAFSSIKKPKFENGYFLIPEIFSLYSNYSESFDFLKRLFFALYHQSSSYIVIDYSNCKQIDIDASVCMDIFLGEFIVYYTLCNKRNCPVKIKEIKPINFEREEIKKILFSIGAFSSIKGLNITYPDIIPYPLKFSIIKHPNASKQREVHITQMVDYVINCLSKMNHELSVDAEKNLFEVIGEVLINAEEHSSGDKRFAIGYFQDSQNEGNHIGIFNLAILNFGKTIYETFSDPNCPNKEVIKDMKELSTKFTQKGLFTKAEYEEETLWTLYALQEGVTSKADWKRGNGSIRFIESFFNLKGHDKKDDVSYLSIMSGNTRIIFDGTYRLTQRQRGKHNKSFNLMTFNNEGDIEAKPDKKYVTFVENYFPGTIISAKICIKEIDTQLS